MDTLADPYDRILKSIFFEIQRWDDHERILTADMTFEQANLDSLDILELVMVVEEANDITIEDDELDKAETLGDLARIACSYLQ